MTKTTYDALALIASYLFMALGVLIVLSGAAWARSEHRAHKAALAHAGSEAVGYIRLVSGTSKRVSSRDVIYVPVEGTLGSSRACDIRIPSAEVPGRAARLTLTQSGMLLSPVASGSVRVNGEEYRSPILLNSDSRIEYGTLSFQLDLLEGAQSLAAARIAPPLSDSTTGLSGFEEPSLRRLFRLRRGSPLDTVELEESAELVDADETDDSIEQDDTDESDESADSTDSIIE
ncbi:hypothetical protein FACS1894184_11170 [Clostridia bacterium]|nr:hypothetical protein FACS1894184_11170 [Clostridia bacterium]